MLKIAARAFGDQQFSNSDKGVLADCVFVVFEVFGECLGDARAVLPNDSPELHAELVDELTALLSMALCVRF